MEFKRIEFIKKKLEYGDVYSFYFKNNGITFIPGQFCHLLVEDGEKREVRDMSFASIPEDDFLMFTMHVDSGSFFKNSLMNLKKGDMISLFKIVGKLSINPSSNKKNIFYFWWSRYYSLQFYYKIKYSSKKKYGNSSSTKRKAFI